MSCGRQACQGNVLSLRALLLLLLIKIPASCFRCDPNCHFWRFCRLQVPKEKPSRWKRWAQFLGTETLPVPGHLADGPWWGRAGAGSWFFCAWKPYLQNRDTTPGGLLRFDWSLIVLRAFEGIGNGVWNKIKNLFKERKDGIDSHIPERA